MFELAQGTQAFVAMLAKLTTFLQRHLKKKRQLQIDHGLTLQCPSAFRLLLLLLSFSAVTVQDPDGGGMGVGVGRGTTERQQFILRIR